MAGVNRVIILGRLGQAPEIRRMQNGDPVATLSVATSEVWTDKQTGDRREVTEWHRVIFFRRQAEIAEQYLDKGSQIYIEGKLKTRKWQDQNGQDRYTTEIIGDQLTMLGSKADSANAENRQNQTATQSAKPSNPNMDLIMDEERADFDDVPF